MLEDYSREGLSMRRYLLALFASLRRDYDKWPITLRELLSSAAQGVVCGVFFVIVQHLCSRPVDDMEVVGAAEVSAIIVTIGDRARRNAKAASKDASGG